MVLIDRTVRLPLFAALALFALAPRADAAEPFTMISPDEVQALLGKPDVHVYDVNPTERFEEGRLPGATHVTKATVADRLPPKKDATLIFYCMNPK
jgi:rhodanese-related sulfurtransferase